MIGFSAILPKLLFMLVGCVFIGALGLQWMAVLRGKSRATPKLIGMTAFLLLWVGLLSQLFVREFYLHRNLHTLRPDSVASIEVNGHVLTDRDNLSRISDVLNRPEWFSVNHGGWADEVPLTIHLKTGEVRTYHVAFYLRREGAVLLAWSGHWAGGQVFYADLPSVLAQAGIWLPTCQSLPDGRFCTSCEHPCGASAH